MKFQTKVSIFFSLGMSAVICLLAGFIIFWVQHNKIQEIYDNQSSLADMVTSENASELQQHLSGQAGYVNWFVSRADGTAFEPAGAQSLDLFFAVDALESLKSVHAGRKSFRLRDKSNAEQFVTVHVGPAFILVASTPLQVFNRYLLVAMFPVLLMGLAMIGASFLIGRAASRLITADLSRLVSAFSTLRPEANTPIDEKGFSKEFREVVTKTNQLQKRIKQFIAELKSKARLESELEIAREVQKSLFPPDEMRSGQFTVRSAFVSADECSGDWYYYSIVGQTLWAVVGDVTGHGVSSAIVASVCRGVWPAIEALPVDQPGLALEHFNNVISALGSSGKFMTMVALSMNLDTMKYYLASASHESPVLVRAGASGSAEMLDADLQPRIGSGYGLKYVSRTGELQKGDNFFLYSDGIFDLALPNGRKLNDKSLIKTLQKQAPANWMNYIKQLLVKNPVDDISLVHVSVS